MEFELEVTVTSNISPNFATTLHYFDDLKEGLEYVAEHYGGFRQWTVVITRVVKRDK